MDDNQLAALLPFMVSAIADKIAVYYQVSEDEAIRRLYDSELYAMLEQEKTKVWHFSVLKLEHHLSGKDTVHLFFQYGVMDYLQSFYDVLHSMGARYLVEDIDLYIEARQMA